MHRLQIELAHEGFDVQFVAVNITSGVEAAPQLVDTCAYPLLQDTDAIGVWTLLGGKKDDLYVFGTDGSLLTPLPAGGEVSTNLSTDEGYKNLKYAIYEALGEPLPEPWPPESTDGTE